MRRGNGTGWYMALTAVAAGLLSAALTLWLSGRGPEGRVVMSGEEYARLSRFAAVGELADTIEREFYAPPPSEEALLAGAARGMVETLHDPYARYYTAGEYEEYLANVNGEYHGLGLLIAQPGELGAEVVKVYQDSPAMAAGIQPGDIITHIGGQAAAAMALEELQALIAAGQEKGAALTLLRAGESLEVEVKGGSVRMEQVEHSLFNQRTGYIAISMFTGGCGEEFQAALEDLQGRGMTSLVIDLRDNPGGSLEQVVQVADALLGRGRRIVSMGGRDGEEAVFDATGKDIGLPLAVLVNGNSASASEILAAAVQENGIGVVVGEDTYGKGVVQTTMYMEAAGGWLKLTTDSYYTPDGNDINGVGVRPDIYCPMPEGAASQEEDSQLWAALNYVRSRAAG